jgi:hypothetical protein
LLLKLALSVTKARQIFRCPGEENPKKEAGRERKEVAPKAKEATTLDDKHRNLLLHTQ